MRTIYLKVLAAVAATCATLAAAAPDGWEMRSPREEIRPRFSYLPEGGPSGRGAFRIEGDGREGLDGCWFKSFPVQGGRYYRFSAWRRAENLEWPQQSANVKIRWVDAKGGRVLDDNPLVEGYLEGYTPTMSNEFPRDGKAAFGGWVPVAGHYRAPAGASAAQLELHLQWAPHGRIDWSEVEFTEAPPPAPRKVRLAAAHFQPREGRTPEEKRRQFAPLIEEAARQKADLVVLGETLTYYGSEMTPVELAEPIPGPSTEYFAELARRHGLYIVAGLFERSGHLVYNVAVLISPEGKVVGKYRKVALPDSEVARGVAPGRDYPVFETRFGRVGMMICYDGFFPEVARELTKRGAEVIAWPVWGVNPELAKARAVENHVYIVSSTYEDVSRNWGFSAVYDHAGRKIAMAKDWGTVVVAEVDLARVTRWRALGDFGAKIPRHLPIVPAARQFE